MEVRSMYKKNSRSNKKKLYTDWLNRMLKI